MKIDGSTLGATPVYRNQDNSANAEKTSAGQDEHKATLMATITSRKERDYVQTSIDSMKLSRDMRGRQDSILQVGKTEAMYGATYADRMLAGQRAADRVKDEKNTAVIEFSKDGLDESTEDLEKKVEETVDPRDENGNPIKKDTTQSTEKAPEKTEIETEPTEEAPTAETPIVPEDDTASEQPTEAPVAPSVDILV